MLFHFLRRFGGAADALVEPAELVMGRRMIRLELDDRFEFADGVLEVSQPLLRQAELKIQGGGRRIDSL